MQDKIYDVPSDWSRRAYFDAAGYEAKYRRSIENPEAFWAEEGRRIHWFRPFTRVKNTRFGPGEVSIRWYEDGTTNAAYTCVDRHLATRGDQTAIIWEGDDPSESKAITYRELHAEVCRMANIMRNRGVQKGDRVTIYLPMIPEAAYAMLACARLGAVHSVVFGGFAPHELAVRIDDATPAVVVAASCGIEGQRIIEYKPLLDRAIDLAAHKPARRVILQRPQAGAAMGADDVDWS